MEEEKAEATLEWDRDFDRTLLREFNRTGDAALAQLSKITGRPLVAVRERHAFLLKVGHGS